MTDIVYLGTMSPIQVSAFVEDSNGQRTNHLLFSIQQTKQQSYFYEYLQYFLLFISGALADANIPQHLYLQLLSQKMISQGTVIGPEGNKFQVMQHLGDGAFATVYKGKNLQNNQIVAIKKMKKMLKSDVMMMEKEIKIMKELQHQNIVQYKTDFKVKEGWFIVLEYCGKGDMEHYKQKIGKIPQFHCKLFVRGILKAIVELHRKKIAHRDLKLANILINDDYELKLADFGFSKDYESGLMKSFCGSPITMSPQILTRQKYSNKCDVWSLGVMTYMMIYNHPPYYPTKTDGEGIIGLTNAVTKRKHKYDQNVRVSPEGIDFMNKCMEKDQNKRSTSQELLKHPWFSCDNVTGMSQVSKNILKDSFTQSPQLVIEKKCKLMLFGVFQKYMGRISQKMQLTESCIQKNVALLKKYYEKQQQILQWYLILVTKKLFQWTSKQIIFKFVAQCIKVQLSEINFFNKHHQQIKTFLNSQIKKKSKQVNIQKQLILFVNQQTQILMDSVNQQEIEEKLTLLKNICKMTITDYDSSVINVIWGQPQQFKDLGKTVYSYLEKLNTQKIVEIINEELSDQEDIEMMWLIENPISEKLVQSKGNQIEIGKLCLYILNIESNFTTDKTMATCQIQLEEYGLVA